MTRLSFYAAAAHLIVMASGYSHGGLAGAVSLAVLPLVPPYRVVHRPEVRL